MCVLAATGYILKASQTDAVKVALLTKTASLVSTKSCQHFAKSHN